MGCRRSAVAGRRLALRILPPKQAYSVFREALGVFACCPSSVDFVPIAPRMPAFRDTHGFTATSQPGTPHYEAYVSTQQPPPQTQARLPRPHAHPRGPFAIEAPAHQGSPQAVCLECGNSSRSDRDPVSDPSTARGYEDGQAGSRFCKPKVTARHLKLVSLLARVSVTLCSETGRSVGSGR